MSSFYPLARLHCRIITHRLLLSGKRTFSRYPQCLSKIPSIYSCELLSNRVSIVPKDNNVAWMTNASKYSSKAWEEFGESNPSNYEKGKGYLIYIGRLNSLVKLFKHFSLTTSAIGFLIQSALIYKGAHLSMGLGITVILGTVLNTYIFVSPLIMQWLTGRYVIHMYYDDISKEFTATTFSLFMRKKELRFKKSDIVVPDMPRLMTSIFAKNKPLLLEPSCFLSRQAFIDVMRYDEPIDFLLKKKDKVDKTI